MQIEGLNHHQRVIADLLWKCDTLERVNEIVQVLGRDAQLVFELMKLAALDEDIDSMQEFPVAKQMLKQISG